MDVARANGALALALTVAAMIVLARDRRRIVILRGDYWRFLAVPWRLTTFVVAEAGMIVVAPLTGDPTWDHVDAATMGALTFATAPFALGVIHRAARGRERPMHLVVALACWLASASWSYDFYILLRDGFYPRAWWSNLVASSVLFVAGGLFWSLEHVEGRGVVFAFMLDDWPQPRSTKFSRVAAYAAIGVAFVAAVLSPFLWEAWREMRR